MFSSGVEFENLVTQMNSENLFFTTTTNVNTYKDLVSRKFVGYNRYFANVDNYKCALFWWHR
jgi:hypothetical protein